MNMEGMILCLLCGIMAGLLIGWGIWKYTEKRRRKRLPACEVRKAPKVLYVPEKDVRGDGPATDGTAAPPEQKEPVNNQKPAGDGGQERFVRLSIEFKDEMVLERRTLLLEQYQLERLEKVLDEISDEH